MKYIILSIISTVLLHSQPYRGFKETTNNSSTEIGAYHALLIAVEEYADKSIPQLSGPFHDANRIRNILVTQYLFEPDRVKLILNPKRSEFYDEFERLSRSLTSRDNLLIFFAGHGNYDKLREQGYWWPADASKDNKSLWISNGDIRDQLKAIKAKHILLVADACFSGAILRTRNALPNATYAIEELIRNQSRRAITSGNLNEVPDKSVFVEYFVKRLSDNTEPYLASLKLFSGIQEVVTNNSPVRQTPQYGVIQEVGDEGGDFIFKRKTEPSRPASVLFSFNTSGIEVLLDDKLLGKTDSTSLFVNEVKTGNVQLILRKEGYETISQSITIKEASENKFKYELLPLSYANLVFTTNVSSNLILNGKTIDVKKQTHKVENVSFGVHEVELTAVGFKNYRNRIVLSRYGDYTYNIDLAPISGSVKFFGTYSANLFVNGDYYAQVPNDKIDIPVGYHSITVRKSGYEDYDANVDVIEDKSITVPYKMVPKSQWNATKMSMVYPGLGQIYNERYTAGYIWAGTFSVSLIGTIATQVNYSKSQQAFEDAANAYIAETDPAIIQSRKNALYDREVSRNDKRNIRNIMMGITVGIYLMNIIDIQITEPGYRISVNTNMESGTAAGATISFSVHLQ